MDILRTKRIMAMATIAATIGLGDMTITELGRSTMIEICGSAQATYQRMGQEQDRVPLHWPVDTLMILTITLQEPTTTIPVVQAVAMSVMRLVYATVTTEAVITSQGGLSNWRGALTCLYLMRTSATTNVNPQLVVNTAGQILPAARRHLPNISLSTNHVVGDHRIHDTALRMATRCEYQASKGLPVVKRTSINPVRWTLSNN